MTIETVKQPVTLKITCNHCGDVGYATDRTAEGATRALLSDEWMSLVFGGYSRHFCSKAPCRSMLLTKQETEIATL